jgi:uncharacterized membrane protein HdeD (DUF308 family)
VPVPVLTLVVGAILSVAGAAALVVAFRHGQADRRAEERRWFRLAVACLAFGSLAFLATVMLDS